VKLAEGCNRTCSFCVIPELRGKQRSRSADDLVREVEQLAAAGVIEVNLVSQDTVAWGRDVAGAPTLASTVERIASVPGIHWVRLFYLYPETLGDDLVTLLAEHPRVVPYVDMPLQHAADGMLRRMRRGHGGKRLYEVVDRLRSRIDGLTFRTAFIVGHPGETDAEFEELLTFVRYAEFDRVGVFRYSDEPSARSHALPGKVTRGVASKRARKLMSVQRAISKKHQKQLVGTELEVLVEGPSEDSDLVMAGRHAGQAPDIDGIVYLSGEPVLPGELVRARVTKASDYDLVADVLEKLPLTKARSKATGPALVHHASDGRRVLRTVS
jgi:ribosomal protein S12 methylthiotransferase